MKKILTLIAVFTIYISQFTSAQTTTHHYHSPTPKDTTHRTKIFSIAPFSLGNKVKVQYEKVIREYVSVGIGGYMRYYRNDIAYFPATKNAGVNAFARWYMNDRAPQGVYFQPKITAHYLSNSEYYVLDHNSPGFGFAENSFELKKFTWAYSAEMDLGAQYLIMNRVPIDFSIGLKLTSTLFFLF